MDYVLNPNHYVVVDSQEAGVGNSINLALYSYVANRPTLMTDPSGTDYRITTGGSAIVITVDLHVDDKKGLGFMSPQKGFDLGMFGVLERIVGTGLGVIPYGEMDAYVDTQVEAPSGQIIGRYGGATGAYSYDGKATGEN